MSTCFESSTTTASLCHCQRFGLIATGAYLNTGSKDMGIDPDFRRAERDTAAETKRET